MADVRVVLVSMAMAMLVVGAGCGGPSKPAATAKPPPPAPTAGQPGARVPPRLLATVDTKLGVKVAVHAAAIHDGTPCWTFVTEGMGAKQHPELVLSLTMRKDEVAERYPAAAVELLGELAAAIPDRTRLEPWRSLTVPDGLLGTDRIGIAAVPAEGPAGLELPDGAVALQLLTAEETDEARDHGAARVAAMIGNHYRFYPTAWWVDQLGQRVSTGDLVAFLQAVEREVIGAVRSAKPTAPTAHVHLTLRPGGGRTVRIEPVPDDRGLWVDDLRRRIERLPATVVTGEVALRAKFSLAAVAGAGAAAP
jgi:hypothetical protein